MHYSFLILYIILHFCFCAIFIYTIFIYYHFIIFIIDLRFSLGYTIDSVISHRKEKSMEKIFRKRIITQIGILTSDIQASKKAWESFLGLGEQPVTESEDYSKTQAVYRGAPLSGRIYQVCFSFENLELELIQPIGDAPSYWKECLEKNGPGVHHISFAVKNMEKCVQDCSTAGFQPVQFGNFPGGSYAYLDATDTLNVVLELLEKEQEVLD